MDTLDSPTTNSPVKARPPLLHLSSLLRADFGRDRYTALQPALRGGSDRTTRLIYRDAHAFTLPLYVRRRVASNVPPMNTPQLARG